MNYSSNFNNSLYFSSPNTKLHHNSVSRFHLKLTTMKFKLSLTTQIMVALVLAIIAGVLLQNQPAFVNEFIKPAGIDRIIDMGRTVMSVTGDASCAVVMQKSVIKPQNGQN